MCSLDSVQTRENLTCHHLRGLFEFIVGSMKVSLLLVCYSDICLHVIFSTSEQDEMLVSERETAVFSDWCSRPECYGHCENKVIRWNDGFLDKSVMAY